MRTPKSKETEATLGVEDNATYANGSVSAL